VLLELLEIEAERLRVTVETRVVERARLGEPVVVVPELALPERADEGARPSSGQGRK